MLLAGQLLAGATILNVVIGIPLWAGALIGAAIMTIYFAAGGLLGSAWVNSLQLVVMLAGSCSRCRSCSRMPAASPAMAARAGRAAVLRHLLSFVGPGLRAGCSWC